MEETAQIEIRLLAESDLPAALRLKELARWNQTDSDWRRLLYLEPSGCFCATTAGRVVGTTTTTGYGSELGWIGMVLVDPEYRRRGIGTRLMHAALDYLRQAGIATVKLDATPDGRPIYQMLGFNVESLIERWAGIAADDIATTGCLPLDSSALREVLALDRRDFAADRSKLLGMLVEDACVTPLVARAPDGELIGYGLARRGSDAAYVGPLVTTDAEWAGLLLDGLLKQMAGQQAYVDLNTAFRTGAEVLRARGFVKQRDLIRMCYGKASMSSSEYIFAIAGPELG